MLASIKQVSCNNCNMPNRVNSLNLTRMSCMHAHALSGLWSKKQKVLTYSTFSVDVTVCIFIVILWITFGSNPMGECWN